MAAGTEADDLMNYIIGLLEADSQVRNGGSLGLHGWYKDRANDPRGWPYGIVGVMSSVGITYPGPRREGVNALIMVKVVGRDGTMESVLKPAYKRVYVVLFGKDGSNADVTVLGKLFQEVDINYLDTQTVNGESIRHVGGGWRSLAK